MQKNGDRSLGSDDRQVLGAVAIKDAGHQFSLSTEIVPRQLESASTVRLSELERWTHYQGVMCGKGRLVRVSATS